MSRSSPNLGYPSPSSMPSTRPVAGSEVHLECSRAVLGEYGYSKPRKLPPQARWGLFSNALLCCPVQGVDSNRGLSELSPMLSAGTTQVATGTIAFAEG